MTYKVSAIVSCYKGEKYLPIFLQNCAQQTLKEQLEIVLAHNEPSEQAKKMVSDFEARNPGLINHIIVPREPLTVSTNRAMRAAKGQYLCIWNVDDLRTPNSLELMAKTLDENPKAGFTYGDYIIINQWPASLGESLNFEQKEGRKIVEPEFEKVEFIQGMHLGPFYMWRKDLCDRVGFWDEQFKSGGDFDYAARLAVESSGKKTQGLLGYYLDEGLGLSTGKTPWQPIERTVIELRFGVYHKLDFLYYTRAKKYYIDEILLNGKFYPLEKFMPNYKKFEESKSYLLYAILRYPFWIIQRLINKLKRRLN